jgi:hypothetical protein
MTTTAQREANRRNAKLSTGPRTIPGKIRASRNALKHGFSIAVAFDPAGLPAVQALARTILGDSDVQILPYARAIAEAQLDINRVRNARHHIIATAYDAPEDPPEVRKNKARIDRFLQDQLDESPVDGEPLASCLLSFLLDSTKPQPRPLERVAVALEETTKKLASLERYERRALSRRKFAVRAFLENSRQLPGSTVVDPFWQNEPNFPNDEV